MSGIPMIASASDVPNAVRYAQRNPGSRWYVARRAQALGVPDAAPAEWSDPGTDAVVAAFGGDWSPPGRDKAAKKGEALKDGSFPIHDLEDLKRAVKAYGRAKDKDKVRKHIIKRARALEATDSLPESWGVTAAVKPHAPNLPGGIGWDESLHPRGKKGWFITKNGSIQIPGPLGTLPLQARAVGARKGVSGYDIIVGKLPDDADLSVGRRDYINSQFGVNVKDDGTFDVEARLVEPGLEQKAEYGGEVEAPAPEAVLEAGVPADVDEDDAALFDGASIGMGDDPIDAPDPEDVIGDYELAIEKYPQHKDRLLSEAHKYLEAEALGEGGEAFETAAANLDALEGKTSEPEPSDLETDIELGLEPGPESQAQQDLVAKKLAQESLQAPEPQTPEAPAAPAASDPTAAPKIRLISNSAVNKGIMSKADADARLDAVLGNPDPVAAHKDLAKLMTELKLGGKQRARYRQLLDDHHGGGGDPDSQLTEAKAVSENLAPDNPVKDKLDAKIAELEAPLTSEPQTPGAADLSDDELSAAIDAKKAHLDSTTKDSALAKGGTTATDAHQKHLREQVARLQSGWSALLKERDSRRDAKLAGLPPSGTPWQFNGSEVYIYPDGTVKYNEGGVFKNLPKANADWIKNDYLSKQVTPEPEAPAAPAPTPAGPVTKVSGLTQAQTNSLSNIYNGRDAAELGFDPGALGKTTMSVTDLDRAIETLKTDYDNKALWAKGASSSGLKYYPAAKPGPGQGTAGDRQAINNVRRRLERMRDEQGGKSELEKAADKAAQVRALLGLPQPPKA